jgi:hypothetical protein
MPGTGKQQCSSSLQFTQGTSVRTGGGQHPAQHSPQGTPLTRQATPTGTPTKFSGQTAGTTCYKCGKTEHYANVCPQRIYHSSSE